MQGTFIQPGREIDYTPTSEVVAGKVVVQANLVGIAKEAIAANTQGALSVAGIFDVVQAAEAITAGSPVYWDADGNPVGGTEGTGAATATATGNTFMGFAQGTTENTDAVVRIALRSAETVAGGVATATSITGTASTLPIAGLSATQGGAVSMSGGASTGSNNNGGAVAIDGGAKNGSGADGAITIGATRAASVGIGKAGVTTTVTGTLAITGNANVTIGASTEAAGSTNADAAALPAGTATVYPTTAADDAKGVIVNAADKVTGRILFIGNGVANKILKVYPPSGGTINGGSENAAFSSASGKGVVIICLSSDDNAWAAW